MLSLGSMARAFPTLRAVRTAKYLKGAQLLARLKMQIWRRKPDAGVALSVRAWTHAWSPGLEKPQSFLGGRQFCFLRRDSEIPDSWAPAGLSLLWLYNLHYFDYLNRGGGASPEDGLELISKWIEANLPGAPVAWDPYPISLRIVNWVRFDRERARLPEQARMSLAHQARWLNANLEHHLLANHIFANAKALLFAGAYFKGAEADNWLRRGVKMLRREVEEQFLPDGGHYERSPMYHAILTGDLLDIVNLAACLDDQELRRLGEICKVTATKALDWLSVMRHPDGRIPLFGDSAFGIAPTCDELLDYAGSLFIDLPRQTRMRNLPSAVHLPSSGFAALRVGAVNVLANVGEVCADYQPGHTHSDTLCFELSLGLQRVVVDKGVSTYEVGDARMEERSGKSHNLMQVDDAEPNEVWKSFRVGRRARIRRAYAAHGPAAAIAEAVHDGYCYLKGVGLHCRRWELTHDALRVLDTIEGRGVRTLSFRLLLHPDVRVTLEGAGALLSNQQEQPLIRIRFPQSFNVSVQNTWWSPRFNQQIPTTQIVAQSKLALPYTSRVEFSLLLGQEKGPRHTAQENHPQAVSVVRS